MPQLTSPPSAPESIKPSLRVLIADDHVDAADMLAMVMSLEGHTVAVAQNGENAIELAENIRPEVAILDIGMPEVDGHAVAQRIRQTIWGSSILLIALTGYGEEEDRNRALESGFDAHFTKPVDPALLFRMIGVWQQQRSQNSEEGL